MARPHRLREIEREQGEALETLIPRLLNELGTMPAVCAYLNTTLQTIGNWCEANGWVKEITWVKRDREVEHA